MLFSITDSGISQNHKFRLEDLGLEVLFSKRTNQI
jgi:hypothetical protein